MSKVDDFVNKVKAEDPRNAEENAELNEQWDTLKAQLPESERADGESRVRAVLKA